MNAVFDNFEHSQKMYELFSETVKEGAKNTIELIRDNLNEGRLGYSFLLHFLIKENLIGKREKYELLEKSEDMMIQELREIFNSKAWRWNERELGNLEFLRRDRNEWGNIKF